MLDRWTEAARAVWGKTEPSSERWLPLVQHLEDAAGVAGHLWDTWVPRVVRERLAGEIGSDVDVRTLAVFLAGTHDVGKASPAFAQLAREVQMGSLVSAMERQGLKSRTLARSDRARHTLTGHVAMQEWLSRRFGYAHGRASALASVVSAHHGTPAESTTAIDAVRRLTGSMGDQAWDAVREEILDTMCEHAGAERVLSSLAERQLSLHALVDLSALVVVADWIASDESRFPYENPVSAAERHQLGVADLDLRAPWSPQRVGGADELFPERFPRLTGVDPTPLQREVVTAAQEAESAPLMLIEAPTGAGKTEAALMASEVLAARFGAGGVYVGLPTMATSNAMFGRVLGWVDAWPAVQDPTLWLAHGKAALNQDFSDLVRTSRRIRAVYDDESLDPRGECGPVRVSGWLYGRRRGLLANVVVGTIDQVLMGALQARHLALRHLALSSKVVVVDEAHSADTYMRSYLCRMLEYLGGYGTPVILLSATLPPVQRQELVEAYQRGRSARTRPPEGGLMRRRVRRMTTSEGAQDAAAAPDSAVRAGAGMGPGPEAYPLITVATDTVQARPGEHDARTLAVELRPLEDDLGVLVHTLEEALADGGCVAVMRNTVRRAQETYDALRAHFGDDVELFHSRFLAADRATRERRLVERLGPPGADRPHRLIVVGTQVLEQSLDIDLDLLVTDLAPVDLIIQRIGRLHRHARPEGSRPGRLRSARCLVTGVEDWPAPVPSAVGGSRRVYEAAHLLRSLAVLTPYLRDDRPLSLPEDGPVLVHAAYDPDLSSPPGWEQAWAEAEERWRTRDDTSRSKAAVHQAKPPSKPTSLTGWTQAPLDDAREETGRAAVRDSEDGIEVILVQQGEHGTVRLLPGDFPGAGAEIPIEPDDRSPLTRHLAACTVGLPQNLTNPRRWVRTVSELEASPVAERWQQSSWLAGQLVLLLDQDGRASLNDHLVTYGPDRGLDVTPMPAKEGI